MTLPDGWRMVKLEDLAQSPRSIVDGPFGSNLARQHYTASGPRVVRLQNIGEGQFLDADAHISREHFESLRKHEVIAGDLLVASLGDPVLRACLAPSSLGDAIVKADCIRVRLDESVDSTFVLYSLENQPTKKWAAAHSHGVGRMRLGLKVIRRLPIPLPPIEEQRRIVEILEAHMSSLDAARAALWRAERRSNAMLKSVLWESTHRSGVQLRLVEFADVRLGRQRSPENHAGDNMVPYLRAANVDWDRLRLRDVKSMHFSEREVATYSLRKGDILLTEASGSATEVGKSVLYPGGADVVCFQNTLLRVRVSGHSPEYVQRWLLAEAMTGGFMPDSRGVGINHLGRARLAETLVHVPSGEEQASSVAATNDALRSHALLHTSLSQSEARAAALRRALLQAAFSGQLTGRSSDLDRAEELVS